MLTEPAVAIAPYGIGALAAPFAEVDLLLVLGSAGVDDVAAVADVVLDVMAVEQRAHLPRVGELVDLFCDLPIELVFLGHWPSPEWRSTHGHSGVPAPVAPALLI